MMPDPHPDQSAQASAQRRQEKQRLFRHPPHLLAAHLAFGLPFIHSKHQKGHHIDDDQPNRQHAPGLPIRAKTRSLAASGRYCIVFIYVLPSNRPESVFRPDPV